MKFIIQTQSMCAYIWTDSLLAMNNNMQENIHLHDCKKWLVYGLETGIYLNEDKCCLGLVNMNPVNMVAASRHN